MSRVRIAIIGAIGLVVSVVGVGIIPVVQAAAESSCSELRVTDPGDNGGIHQLRTVIASACTGARIEMVASHIVLHQGELLLQDKVLTIAGNEDHGRAVIDANGQSRVLEILGGNVTLMDVTITGGRTAPGDSGGGISQLGGHLTLRDAKVTGNKVTALPDLTVPGTTGGGISNVGGVLDIRSSIVSGNSAGREGGGVSNFSVAPSAPAFLTLDNESTVSANSAALRGGGILSGAVFGGAAWLTLNDDSRVANNTAGLNAGGIFNIGIFGGTASVILNGESRVIRNTAAVDAGGVWNTFAFGGTATVTLNDESRVTRNTPNNCVGTVC